MPKQNPKNKSLNRGFLKDEKIVELAKTLSRQIERKINEERFLKAKEVLQLVAAGFFFSASLVAPNLPRSFKKFFKDEEFAYKRFNIPYLKRTLARLQKEKLVQITHEGKYEIVKITEKGKQKILKFAFDEIEIKKPAVWDGKWYLVSYDIPKKLNFQRKIFSYYLKSWKFYPLHQSLFLHAYPCKKEIEFLKEYLGISEYVRIFTVIKIENDKIFKEFFGV
jgi:hypothetical protein